VRTERCVVRAPPPLPELVFRQSGSSWGLNHGKCPVVGAQMGSCELPKSKRAQSPETCGLWHAQSARALAARSLARSLFTLGPTADHRASQTRTHARTRQSVLYMRLKAHKVSKGRWVSPARCRCSLALVAGWVRDGRTDRSACGR
jgi:hypothetical protein